MLAQAISSGLISRGANPNRVLAKGSPIYTSFIAYFADDVSGNCSKSWNKHMNAYITHQNLPRKLLQHEQHNHFASTSQHASASEQFEPVKKIIEFVDYLSQSYLTLSDEGSRRSRKEPIHVYNASTREEALIRLAVLFGPSDNPMASEMCGHIGDKGNYPCRKCGVGDSRKQKEENPGFEALFSPQSPRSAASVCSSIDAPQIPIYLVS